MGLGWLLPSCVGRLIWLSAGWLHHRHWLRGSSEGGSRTTSTSGPGPTVHPTTTPAQTLYLKP